MSGNRYRLMQVIIWYYSSFVIHLTFILCMNLVFDEVTTTDAAFAEQIDELVLTPVALM